MRCAPRMGENGKALALRVRFWRHGPSLHVSSAYSSLLGLLAWSAQAAERCVAVPPAADRRRCAPNVDTANSACGARSCRLDRGGLARHGDHLRSNTIGRRPCTTFAPRSTSMSSGCRCSFSTRTWHGDLSRGSANDIGAIDNVVTSAAGTIVQSLTMIRRVLVALSRSTGSSRSQRRGRACAPASSTPGAQGSADRGAGSASSPISRAWSRSRRACPATCWSGAGALRHARGALPRRVRADRPVEVARR